MLTRTLLVLAALAAGAAVANGEPTADLDLPPPCRAKPAGDLPALEKRKERLERQIALARAAKPARTDDGAKALSKTQTALLEILFQIQCLKLRQETAGAGRPATAREAKRRGVVALPPPPAGRPDAVMQAPMQAPMR